MLSDRARAPSGERRSDGAEVTSGLVYDAATGCAAYCERLSAVRRGSRCFPIAARAPSGERRRDGAEVTSGLVYDAAIGRATHTEQFPAVKRHQRYVRRTRSMRAERLIRKQSLGFSKAQRSVHLALRIRTSPL